jgi:Tol biopolymer transport system component
VRTLFEEKSQTQVGDASLTENLWRVLPGSNELIWWSQRDNWIHLYLYDLATGRLKNRITAGEGNVADIVRVDEKARVIYFLGQGKEPGRDPYFQHLYRIGFDGKGQALLTPTRRRTRRRSRCCATRTAACCRRWRRPTSRASSPRGGSRRRRSA